jgi:hypothetical protein
VKGPDLGEEDIVHDRQDVEQLTLGEGSESTKVRLSSTDVIIISPDVQELPPVSSALEGATSINGSDVILINTSNTTFSGGAILHNSALNQGKENSTTMGADLIHQNGLSIHQPIEASQSCQLEDSAVIHAASENVKNPGHQENVMEPQSVIEQQVSDQNNHPSPQCIDEVTKDQGKSLLQLL